jgi:hypothetical protein
MRSFDSLRMTKLRFPQDDNEAYWFIQVLIIRDNSDLKGLRLSFFVFSNTSLHVIIMQVTKLVLYRRSMPPEKGTHSKKG